MKPTTEQTAAIAATGKTIVSASAGSGKTFVMIEKLVNAVAGGVDLDEVLAVTFTKKAAAQMKDKLRAAIIKRVENAGEEKPRLKAQLSKISSANISTIHSFCARLIRTYFYALDGVDSGFDIISADDATGRELKAQAVQNLFDKLYEEDDGDFKLLLSCFMKRRSDASLKALLWEAYNAVRAVARYREVIKNSEKLYGDEGFKRVCSDYFKLLCDRIDPMIYAVRRFKDRFPRTKKQAVYNTLFEEMESALKQFKVLGLFGEKPPLTVTRKPADCAEDKEAGEDYKIFRDGINKRYCALCPDLKSEEEERAKFLNGGKVAVAFSRVLMKLDDEYAAVKADENKLDYNDLEHLTLQLLSNEKIRREIISGFKCVFVDEYQDVNPVQEEIISALTGETFLVGDVKQAIYGFRGSRSVFFTEKFCAFEREAGNALRLKSNFRSSDGVLNFVNKLFSGIMRADTCGVDYAADGVMFAGGQYPEGYGEAQIHVFGKEEKEDKELPVYSVQNDDRKSGHTREGLAVAKIIKEELSKRRYDLKSGKFVPTQAGDICILTRKNSGTSTEGIIKAVRDLGYAVSGAQESNVCELAEVKQMLDVLSLIDNGEQDMPLVTALLSPLGGFCEDELAEIRIAFRNEKEVVSFKDCCEKFTSYPGEISRKLHIFGGHLEKLRSLAALLPAGEIIDELLENYGFESGYGADGDEKVKNVLRLKEEGATLPLAAFLQRIKSGGNSVSSPAPAPSDSIKIMSMHASKGLEFPVVIIADVCRTFKGQDYEEMPFSEEYGFAPKAYDRENMIAEKTVLGRLSKLKKRDEELNNELNLFYVACTRAMCNLHILAEEAKPFEGADLRDARCYADLFDISAFAPVAETGLEEIAPSEFSAPILYAPDVDLPEDVIGEFAHVYDEELIEEIKGQFNRPYKNADGVDLPVKSSASAILRQRDEEPYEAVRVLFDGEDETGTERGTAYHRFLELCDFAKKEERDIEREIAEFEKSGKITAAQSKLLNAAELSKILKMPAFEGLKGATLYREREFLCKIPANEIFKTAATDSVLIQGAIDLLAVTEREIIIIDYKYSHKSPAGLLETYAPQLQLYKKAVSIIMRCPPSEIAMTIVNIHTLTQTAVPDASVELSAADLTAEGI